jgi:hypothetical protein
LVLVRALVLVAVKPGAPHAKGSAVAASQGVRGAFPHSLHAAMHSQSSSAQYFPSTLPSSSTCLHLPSSSAQSLPSTLPYYSTGCTPRCFGPPWMKGAVAQEGETRVPQGCRPPAKVSSCRFAPSWMLSRSSYLTSPRPCTIDGNTIAESGCRCNFTDSSPPVPSWMVRSPDAQVTEIARRKGAPVIRKSTRGSLGKALASGRPENRYATMAKYVEDKYTSQGHIARQALWNTWRRPNTNWCDPAVSVLPLTALTIAAVLSPPKAGGYRSVGYYLSRAKHERQLSHPWS